MGILMRVVGFGIASDDDLAAGNTEVYADAEQIALPPARMLAFDDDAAGYDVPDRKSAQAPRARARIRAATVSELSM